MGRDYDENIHTTSICNEFLNLFLNIYVCHAEINDTTCFDAYECDFDTYLRFVSCLLPNFGRRLQGKRGRGAELERSLTEENGMHESFVSNTMPGYECNHEDE